MPASHTKTASSCKLAQYSCVTTNAIFTSFGGTDGQYHYNDTWSYDLQTRQWTELNCIGFIPLAREGHAAALVDDVIYIFGGRGVDGKDLSDLAAFKISSLFCCLCVQHSTHLKTRSAVVHVPKYGPGTNRAIGSRHGLCGR